jgi:hypothetical protein
MVQIGEEMYEIVTQAMGVFGCCLWVYNYERLFKEIHRTREWVHGEEGNRSIDHTQRKGDVTPSTGATWSSRHFINFSCK